MKKTAIVTGVLGYIGFVLSKMLKEQGFYVIGIDSATIEHDNRYRHCDVFINTDFTHPVALKAIVDNERAAVFHLAASSLLGPSATDPLSYYENNTTKTLKLIQTLKQSHRLVFASTAAVYGHEVGYKSSLKYEFSTLNPPNNYGRSKLWCEQMIDSCYAILKLKVTSFRFFNVIGAYGDCGQQKGTPHIINKLCESAALGSPFQVYGNDWDTRDGTCVRDYVHVEDICRALIHASEYMYGSEYCHLKFNLGTMTGTTVREIIDAFKIVAGLVKVQYTGRREGDPAFLVANPELFCNTTNFVYKYTSAELQQMISGAWKYYTTFP